MAGMYEGPPVSEAVKDARAKLAEKNMVSTVEFFQVTFVAISQRFCHISTLFRNFSFCLRLLYILVISGVC